MGFWNFCPRALWCGFNPQPSLGRPLTRFRAILFVFRCGLGDPSRSAGVLSLRGAVSRRVGVRSLYGCVLLVLVGWWPNVLLV